MSTELETDFAAVMNAKLGGFDRGLGVQVVSASTTEVVVTYDVDPRHHQPYGIVHGGMHCAVHETACSIGAGLNARQRGQAGAVGLENHTSFIHAIRSGRVTVTARPLTRGRQTQLWEATSRDESGRIVASGRVRLLCLSADTELAGQTVDPNRT